MDCWVAQLGVDTQDHHDLAGSHTLRRDTRTGKVVLAASDVLRHRELAPFVLNMGGNGALSSGGVFRTTPDDVRAIDDVQIERARSDLGAGRRRLAPCSSAGGSGVSSARWPSRAPRRGAR